MNEIRFGDWLYDTRKKNRLTQEELAKKIHISRVMISRYENYTMKPSTATVAKLIRAMDCDTLPALTPTVAHAKIINTRDHRGKACGNCKSELIGTIIPVDDFRFCPYCGAKFDLEVLEK